MNRLAGSTSPYLQQHADNPVDWYPWGEAAFDEAKRRGVPIFLSVSYSSCHWCHVMAPELVANGREKPVQRNLVPPSPWVFSAVLPTLFPRGKNAIPAQEYRSSQAHGDRVAPRERSGTGGNSAGFAAR